MRNQNPRDSFMSAEERDERRYSAVDPNEFWDSMFYFDSYIMQDGSSSEQYIQRAIEALKVDRMDEFQGLLLQEFPIFYRPIDSKQKTILHYACEWNNFQAIKIIFDILFEETTSENLLRQIHIIWS